LDPQSSSTGDWQQERPSRQSRSESSPMERKIPEE
jgi:hypothetical protein